MVFTLGYVFTNTNMASVLLKEKERNIKPKKEKINIKKGWKKKEKLKQSLWESWPKQLFPKLRVKQEKNRESFIPPTLPLSFSKVGKRTKKMEPFQLHKDCRTRSSWRAEKLKEPRGKMMTFNWICHSGVSPHSSRFHSKLKHSSLDTFDSSLGSPDTVDSCLESPDPYTYVTLDIIEVEFSNYSLRYKTLCTMRTHHSSGGL